MPLIQRTVIHNKIRFMGRVYEYHHRQGTPCAKVWVKEFDDRLLVYSSPIDDNDTFIGDADCNEWQKSISFFYDDEDSGLAEIASRY